MPRRAFTILEVALVAVLVLILAAMAYPSIEAIYGDVRLTAAADLIRARWADARAHAIEEGRPYRFAVIPQSGQFRVAPDGADVWGGQGGDMVEAPPDAKPLDVEEALPKGVTFADAAASEDADSSGQWSTLVRFMPDGTADRDVEISFTANGNRSLVLKLRGLTGSVTAQAPTAGK
jgi:Tfp pilus assembly protein FimT